MSGATTDEYVLGYWDIKGLAAPIRMAFHFKGVPYRDELYSLTFHEGKWRSTWPNKAKEMMATGASAFPNLPYLLLPPSAEEQQPQRVFVQSGAIMRYVSRVTGLSGSNDVEVLQVDELMEQVMDLRNEMTRLVYGPDFAQKRESFCRESLPYYFNAFEKYLENPRLTGASSGEPESAAAFYVGGRVTVADFAISDALDVAALLMKPFIDADVQYPKTCAHRKRIRSLPELQEYFNGPLAAMPFNNKVASWGGAATVD